MSRSKDNGFYFDSHRYIYKAQKSRTAKELKRTFVSPGNMLRTNHSFLTYIEELYAAQWHKKEISLKAYPKGRMLFSQGEKANMVLVVKNGFTKCFFKEENDKEYIVEFLGMGEIVGEVEALRDINCLCSIQALTDVQAFSISMPFFKSLLKGDLSLNNLLLNVFAERIVNTSSRASYQQLHTVEYSLAKLLELQMKQSISITKEDMAAYLGVTIRSLNRALKDLG